MEPQGLSSHSNYGTLFGDKSRSFFPEGASWPNRPIRSKTKSSFGKSRAKTKRYFYLIPTPKSLGRNDSGQSTPDSTLAPSSIVVIQSRNCIIHKPVGG